MGTREAIWPYHTQGAWNEPVMPTAGKSVPCGRKSRRAPRGVARPTAMIPERTAVTARRDARFELADKGQDKRAGRCGVLTPWHSSGIPQPTVQRAGGRVPEAPAFSCEHRTWRRLGTERGWPQAAKRDSRRDGDSDFPRGCAGTAAGRNPANKQMVFGKTSFFRIPFLCPDRGGIVCSPLAAGKDRRFPIYPSPDGGAGARTSPTIHSRAVLQHAPRPHGPSGEGALSIFPGACRGDTNETKRAKGQSMSTTQAKAHTAGGMAAGTKRRRTDTEGQQWHTCPDCGCRFGMPAGEAPAYCTRCGMPMGAERVFDGGAD